MAFITTVKPAIEPVTLQQAKSHLIVEHDLDDMLIDLLIQSARESIEMLTERPLITRTLEYTSNCFDDVMELKPSLTSVASVAYIDTDGNTQTLATSNYYVDTRPLVGLVGLTYGASWPSLKIQPNAITITFDAGYGSSRSDVPAPLVSAMLLLIGHLYENREATAPINIHDVPMGVKFLIAPYRAFL